MTNFKCSSHLSKRVHSRNTYRLDSAQKRCQSHPKQSQNLLTIPTLRLLKKNNNFTTIKFQNSWPSRPKGRKQTHRVREGFATDPNSLGGVHRASTLHTARRAHLRQSMRELCAVNVWKMRTQVTAACKGLYRGTRARARSSLPMRPRRERPSIPLGATQSVKGCAQYMTSVSWRERRRPYPTAPPR